jgi:hypothetical protein
MKVNEVAMSKRINQFVSHILSECMETLNKVNFLSKVDDQTVITSVKELATDFD